MFPTEVSRTMHTITIRFRKNYFSDENGAVLGYSIIVGEDYTKNTEGDSFLPSWWDVQKYSTWPPYQVNIMRQLAMTSALEISVGMFIV